MAYQAATAFYLAQFEGQWSSFNAMLLANGIVFGAIGLAATGQAQVPVLNVGMPVVGVILCALQFIQTSRSHGYLIFSWLRAQELEERLPEDLRTFSLAYDFRNGKEVQFTVRGRVIPHRMSLFGRLRITYAIVFLIVAFATLCASVLVYVLK